MTAETPTGCAPPSTSSGGGGQYQPKKPSRHDLDIYVRWGARRHVSITTTVDGRTFPAVSMYSSPYHYHQDIGFQGNAHVEAYTPGLDDRIGLECEILVDGWTHDLDGPNARTVKCDVHKLELG